MTLEGSASLAEKGLPARSYRTARRRVEALDLRWPSGGVSTRGMLARDLVLLQSHRFSRASVTSGHRPPEAPRFRPPSTDTQSLAMHARPQPPFLVRD